MAPSSDPPDPRGPRPRTKRDPAAPTHEARTAAPSIESELEELGDPEAGPVLPASTLAAQSALAKRETARDGGRGVPAPGAPWTTSITREIFRLAWPVMLSQGLVSLSGLVDRAMIGRLGGDAGSAVPLAAVGYATQFFFLIQSALFAVGLACVALMARAIGAANPARSREVLIASLQVALGVTLAFTAIMLWDAPRLLALLGARDDVIETGLGYLHLVVGSSVLLAVTLTLDSALRANRDSRTPMLVALAITAVKLLGNWLLIFGAFGFPRLGLEGAGWATLVSQAIGVAIFAVLFARRAPESPDALRWRGLARPSPLCGEVMRIALPGVAERVVLNLGLLSYFWVLSSYYGTIAVAAYTVGVPLLSFSWIPGSGYAQACATLVGQRLGAHDPGGADATGVRATLLALGTAIPLGLFFAVFRYPIAEVFTADRAVVAALGPFMLALAVGQPFLQLHFTLGGAHRGSGDTWTPLFAASVGNWVFRVPLACAFAMLWRLDVVWVWYALVIDHASRAAILLYTYRRGRWKERLGEG